jgi:hypothetical protein
MASRAEVQYEVFLQCDALAAWAYGEDEGEIRQRESPMLLGGAASGDPSEPQAGNVSTRGTVTIVTSAGLYVHKSLATDAPAQEVPKLRRRYARPEKIF